ncbi:Apoptosis inhibitory protein 5 (API5) family protein [Brugia pahangi]
MSNATIDDIYDACERLDKAKVKDAEDYKIFISGTKGNDGKVKKLCAHMIVRYWQDFTDLRNVAFYSLVSLLEDRDPDIRKAVIREVSHVVKSGELVDKIADVLSQMLQQTDELQEITMLTNVLVQFLKSHPKDVLSAIFVNVVKSEEESVRLRLLKFIQLHVRDIPVNLMNEDLMISIEHHIREVLRDITAVEFDLIFNFMRSLEFFRTAKGRVILYKIVVDQIQIDEPLPANDPQRFDQILYFVERARLLLSASYRGSELVNFMISKGIPVLEEVDAALRIRFLRILVELAPFSKSLERSDLMILSDYFSKLIPPLPSERSDENMGDVDASLEQELRLSELETTSLAFASFCRTDKTAFDYMLEHSKDSANWRKRIIYLGRLLQHYIISANSELQKMRKLEPSKRDTNQLLFQQNSLKMAENTLHLTKMLAHKSPSFIFVITPSWKMESRKRDYESEVGTEQKRKRPVLHFYVPPGGKYSGMLNRGGRKNGTGGHSNRR